MGFIQGLIGFVGRVGLAGIFLFSVAGKLMDFNGVTAKMAAEGIQFPTLMLLGAIAFLILGGLSVALGLFARFGALLLAVFLGLATYYFHDFWYVSEHAYYVHSLTDEKTPVFMMEVGNFMKNTALLGAMLFIVANGAGPGSLDRLFFGGGDEN